MSKRDDLQEIADRGDPVEWLNVLKHEATRANNAEERADYLQREINKMRRVMQTAGTWDQFCKDYAAAEGRRFES